MSGLNYLNTRTEGFHLMRTVNEILKANMSDIISWLGIFNCIIYWIYLTREATAAGQDDIVSSGYVYFGAISKVSQVHAWNAYGYKITTNLHRKQMHLNTVLHFCWVSNLWNFEESVDHQSYQSLHMLCSLWTKWERCVLYIIKTFHFLRHSSFWKQLAKHNF